MAAKNEYLSWLIEQLAPLGAIRSKAMFGGYGIYCDELFFAIVVDDVLYFKADDESIPDYTAYGLLPFRYHMKDGSPQTMKYYPPPEAALEEQPELLQWARKGLAAALRAPQRKKKSA
ncbi:DNA transformation protein [Andreprevotia lacus DSM 23236]|jgi:DNA transformation protein|uniref:DNA transformation protein n=1 Tax=Andreprevotia lacus DSM 23236 TaxID=1121001 RepID=A0A1W1XU57_9NEIS|nr:TfoX/Sxy family protein [Andreprevotia lacus]SMC27071.1 DNA transformation protein [Andreprevotia lacus DSM 23236]